jgi:hypothetical protein
MRIFARFTALCGLTLMLASCGSVTSPSQLAPLDFTGSLDPAGTASMNFSVDKLGEMQMTLQSLTPRPVIGFISIAVGQPVGATCSPLAGYYVTQAAIGQQYAFSQIQKGAYCLYAADSNGILTATTTFTIHVLHP